MFTQLPSPSNVHPWNGHSSVAPLHLAADAEVRAEVRAVRVLEVELAALVAPEHEVGAPVAQRGGTSPGSRSSGYATWNQPKGCGNGKLRSTPTDSRTCSHSAAGPANRSFRGSSV